MKLSLNTQILSGVVIGIVAGVFLNISGSPAALYAPAIYERETAGGSMIVQRYACTKLLHNNIPEPYNKSR